MSVNTLVHKVERRYHLVQTPDSVSISYYVYSTYLQFYTYDKNLVSSIRTVHMTNFVPNKHFYFTTLKIINATTNTARSPISTIIHINLMDLFWCFSACEKYLHILVYLKLCVTFSNCSTP